MNELKYENYSFSLMVVRVVATLLILACHFVQESNNSLLILSAQFLNVGVSIFFFLSGFLYGNKDIKDSKSWL